MFFVRVNSQLTWFIIAIEFKLINSFSAIYSLTYNSIRQKKCKIRPKSHTNNSCLEAKSGTRTKFACHNCDPNGNVFDWINLSKSQVKVDRTVPFSYIFGIQCILNMVVLYMCAYNMFRYLYPFAQSISIYSWFSTRKSRKTTENDKSYIYFNIISITSIFCIIQIHLLLLLLLVLLFFSIFLCSFYLSSNISVFSYYVVYHRVCCTFEFAQNTHTTSHSSFLLASVCMASI